jgi:CHAT domain-containing protein
MELRSEYLAVPPVAPARARATREELDAVVAAIRALSSFDTFAKTEIATVSLIQAALESDETLIYIAVTDRGTVAMTLSHSELDVLWPSLTRQALKKLIATKQPRADSVLGEGLMLPIAKWLLSHDVERAVLVPVGELRLVPLHAIRIEVDHCKCLADRCAVSVIPNATVLASTRQRVSSGGADADCFFGLANPQGSLPRLPAAEPEVAAGAALFDAARVSLGESVRMPDVVDAMRSASHVHFACHGYFDRADPLRSGLDLGDAGQLTLRHLLDGTIRLTGTPLVVLSACVTALADPGRLPDEGIGLPAAFIHAGASAVVGSLWSVNDAATSIFMVRFYEEQRRRSQRPVDALRLAQLWLRDADREEIRRFIERHPQLQYVKVPKGGQPFADAVFWAPFVYCGA